MVSIQRCVACAVVAGGAVLLLSASAFARASAPRTVTYDGDVLPKPASLQQHYAVGQAGYSVRVRLDGERARATVLCGRKVLAKDVALEGLGLDGHKLVGLDLETAGKPCGRTFSLRTFMIPDKFDEVPQTIVNRFNFAGGRLDAKIY